MFQALLDFGFQGVEALADELFGIGRSGLEPGIADGLEAALFAAEPLEAEGLDCFRRGERGGRGFDFAGDGGKGLVEFGFAVAGQVGDGPHVDVLGHDLFEDK